MEVFYTFVNTHAVIFAERILLAAGLPVKVRPIPGVISAGCGMGLCFPLEFRQAAEKEMGKNSAAFSAVYSVSGGQYELIG